MFEISYCVSCGSSEIESSIVARFFSGVQVRVKCEACGSEYGVRPDEAFDNVD